MSLTGELAALSAAFLWALASVAYTDLGRQVSPLGLNLSKGVMALAMIGLTLTWQGELIPEITSASLWLLLISGAIGIGLGDTVYFEALRYLGARRTLLLGSLAPPITACLALIFLQEILPTAAWFGMSLTVLGVTWVISERVPDRQQNSAQTMRGVSFALLAALAQAGGAVLSRAALAETSVSPLWAALLRLLAGVLVLLLWGLLQRQLGRWLIGLNSRRLVGILVLAAFGGTYLGIWLQQVALKFTAAGIAQTLGATSPLFVLPVIACLGEAISTRAWLGALIAVAGVAFLCGLQ